MPDFSHKAVHKFWKGYADPNIYPVITFMEGMEDWSIDGNNAVEQHIQKLGEALENIGEIELKQETGILKSIIWLKTGRGLRILMCLDMAYPGAASKVLMHAEEQSKQKNKEANFFLKRNVVFERLRLLRRVFANKRIELITKALEESSYV